MKSVTAESALNSRKSKFVHFRWLLFIWLGAFTVINHRLSAHEASVAQGILALFAVSQAVLWMLPKKQFEGMRILNGIFLLDLNFILAGLWMNNQLQPDLLVMLFLGTFMSAISKSLPQSLATTLVLSAVYLSAKMKTPGGFDFMQPQQMLQLPFLFISSAHSSLLASEAASELDARHVLHADKTRLSRQMNSTFTEIARYCKDMSALVDALPFGAIMLDSSRNVRVLNDIAEEVLSVDSSKVLASPLTDDPSLARLAPFLDSASHDPLIDFQKVEIPGEQGAAWTLNLGVYPILEGDENRGLLIVMIPQGYGDALKDSLPLPVVLPAEASPRQEGILLSPAHNAPGFSGLSLAELGLNYG